MKTSPDTHVSLTSQWFIKPGREAEAFAALEQVARDVHDHEPDTLIYLVHSPLANRGLQSLPPSDPSSVLFFEVYRSAKAFQAHLAGPTFTSFVEKHGGLFVAANGKPFTFVEFLACRAGFIRSTEVVIAPAAGAVNDHPSVMFEIIANDQAHLKDFYHKAFGWSYTSGTAGFAYVKFPVETLPLLGGIGQADSHVPGLAPGRNFYLLVDDLEAAIEKAVRAGGARLMEPTESDGYHFAMIKDPEGNPVGLVKPFKA
jgi:predicted enzyme related to lactoylglutathione lyase/quinol monooxygenase YgiN